MSTAKAGIPRGWLIALGLAVVAAAAPHVSLIPGNPTVKAGLATVAVTVLLLATGMIPALATAAIFFVLALATKAAPPLVLASGLWSNAIMLIFGGLVIGVAAERSGLGRYIARGLMRRFLGSYPRLLIGILVGAGSLSLLVPSTMGRLAITIPVVLATLKEAGYAHGSNGYNGAILTTVAGNFLTSYSILPANLVQIITLGAAEAAYPFHITYGEYMLLAGPVLGLVKGVTFIAVVLWVFPAPPPSLGEPADLPGALTPAARRLGVVLGLAVALWATDFLHRLNPGWIALAAGLLCMAPPLGLVAPREMAEINKLTGLLTVPMVLGLAGVITHSGAGRLITEAATAALPLTGHGPAFGFAVLAVITSAVSLFATTVGCIAVVTPLVGEVATATGLDPKVGTLAVLTGLQALFFHYEATPVMVGLLMGRVGPRSAARLMVPLAIVGLLAVLPAQILWLKLIGYL